jgi:flagellar export protein FliJ
VATEHATFIAQRSQADRLAAAVRTAAGREIEAVAVQREKRDDWGVHAQRVASLERLDDRARDEHRIEADREELKLVDDLVTSRFGREARDA